LGRDEILRLQRLVRRVPAAPSVIRYALELVRRTRPRQALPAADDDCGQAALAEGGEKAEREMSRMIDRLVTYGAGPRAVQFLLLGGKARAVMLGRQHVSIADIRALAHPVLRHRVLTNYTAEAEGFDPDRIISRLLETCPGPSSEETRDARVRQILES